MSSARRFSREYLLSLSQERRRELLAEAPAVLDDLLGHWPALSTDRATWSNESAFMAKYGHHVLEDPLPCQLPKPQKCPLRRHTLAELATAREFLIVPDGDLTADDQSFLQAIIADHPLPELLQNVAHPGFSVGVVAGKGVGHSRHGPAWLAIASGAKLWFLAPPHSPEPEQPACHDLRLANENSRRDGVLHHLQLPGEVVAFPNGWWHSTCNLSPFTPAIGGFFGVDSAHFYTSDERAAAGLSDTDPNVPQYKHWLYERKHPKTKKRPKQYAPGPPPPLDAL